MASISSSPIRAQTLSNSLVASRKSGSSRKRRPVDPEETGSVAVAAPYSSEMFCAPSSKRAKTIDDVLGSLSLRAPDPPGNSFCLKRKSGDVEVDDDGDGRSTKMIKSGSTTSRRASSSAMSMGNPREESNHHPLEPDGRKSGTLPTNATSEMLDLNTQQQPQIQCTSCAQPICHCQQQQNIHVTTVNTSPKTTTTTNNNNDEMAIDDNNSDLESCDSSISEGSIRNAMYQLVFGRRNNNNPSLGAALPAPAIYDAVDSKIEDLIRRSRMKAVIDSQKEKKCANGDELLSDGMDMEMEEEKDNGWSEKEVEEEDDDWLPGHG